MPRGKGSTRQKPTTVVPMVPPPIAPVAAPRGVGGDASNRGLQTFGLGLVDLEQKIAENPELFPVEDLKLEEIVDSPINPKHRQSQDEESLSDILPSVREFGVAQPVLVCERDVLIRNSPSLDAQTKPGKYVMLAGHRRRAATAVAGRSSIPAIVRNEFASLRALTQLFLFENGGRLRLNPIEEAEGYRLLAEDGLSYQEIVDTVGGSVKNKGQVSQRIQLLKLTDLGQALLIQDRITVQGALTLLAKLPDLPESQDAALRAATETEPPETRPTLGAAIEQERRRLDEVQQTAKLQEMVAAAGIPEIEPQVLWGEDAWQHHLATDAEVESAREDGTLAGVAVVDGTLSYFRSEVIPTILQEPTVDEHDPDDSLDAPRLEASSQPVEALERKREEAERRQAHHAASRKRKHACSRIIAEFTQFSSNQRTAMVEILAEALLAGGVDNAVLRLRDVHEWAERTIQTEWDLGELLAGERAQVTKIALATALAALEQQAADEQYLDGRPWPRVVVRYIQRMVDLGFHSLTPYEQSKLGTS